MGAFAQLEFVPLRALLRDKQFSNKGIQRALDAFQCDQEEDIGVFLRHRAITNEKTFATRTYLFVDAAEYEQQRLHIAGFFTLAIVSTDFSSVSDEDRLAILGNVPKVRTNDYFPGYLVSHFARNDECPKELCPGADMMVAVEDIIVGASLAVGGSTIYLDCHDILIGYYEGYGYSMLYQDPATGLNKMIKKVPLD